MAKDTVPFVDLRAQSRALAGALRRAMERVIHDADYILGRELEAFESEFARATGAKHAIGVASGLDALRFSLRGRAIGPGDEVIVPASTFIATALAVTDCGAKVVLADCDAATGNVDPAAARAAVTPKTRALIAVHLCGQPADMGPLLELARAKRLDLFEDAAQAHGARWRGKPCGSLGRAAAFSFYPSKNLGAAGDGGMVTTDDGVLAEKIRSLRHYGQRTKNVHSERSFNARLDTLQAAILRVKLKRLNRWNALRVKHARAYRELLAGVGDLAFQAPQGETAPVYHLLTIETVRRDALKAHLEKAGVEVGIHYPIPLHLQPAYADHGWREGDFPNAERRCRRTLSLPMFPELTPAQIERVAGSVRTFFS